MRLWAVVAPRGSPLHEVRASPRELEGMGLGCGSWTAMLAGTIPCRPAPDASLPERSVAVPQWMLAALCAAAGSELSLERLSAEGGVLDSVHLKLVGTFDPRANADLGDGACPHSSGGGLLDIGNDRHMAVEMLTTDWMERAIRRQMCGMPLATSCLIAFCFMGEAIITRVEGAEAQLGESTSSVCVVGPSTSIALNLDASDAHTRMEFGLATRTNCEDNSSNGVATSAPRNVSVAAFQRLWVHVEPRLPPHPSSQQVDKRTTVYNRLSHSEWSGEPQDLDMTSIASEAGHVLLTGPAGVGKGALLHSVCEHAKGRGARIINLSCLELVGDAKALEKALHQAFAPLLPTPAATSCVTHTPPPTSSFVSVDVTTSEKVSSSGFSHIVDGNCADVQQEGSGAEAVDEAPNLDYIAGVPRRASPVSGAAQDSSREPDLTDAYNSFHILLLDHLEALCVSDPSLMGSPADESVERAARRLVDRLREIERSPLLCLAAVRDARKLPRVLLSHGAFQYTVFLGPPGAAQREQILRAVLGVGRGSPLPLETLSLGREEVSGSDDTEASLDGLLKRMSIRDKGVGCVEVEDVFQRDVSHIDSLLAILVPKTSGLGPQQLERLVTIARLYSASRIWSRQQPIGVPLTGDDKSHPLEVTSQSTNLRVEQSPVPKSPDSPPRLRPSATPINLGGSVSLNLGGSVSFVEHLLPSWEDFARALTHVNAGVETGSASTGCTDFGGGVAAMPTDALVGGYKVLRQKLRRLLTWPIERAKDYEALGIRPPGGVLLFGSTGNGKTLLAQAAASASGCAVFRAKGPALFGEYVGDTEESIRELFRQARESAPSIVIIDEIDALGARRGGDDGSVGGSQVARRALSALLNELDGLGGRAGVVLLACTSQPEAIDAALLRPGRLDELLLVPPPTLEDRREILKVHCARLRLAPDVDLSELAANTERFSGAALAALCREAAAGMLARNMRRARHALNGNNHNSWSSSDSDDPSSDGEHEEGQAVMRRAEDPGVQAAVVLKSPSTSSKNNLDAFDIGLNQDAISEVTLDDLEAALGVVCASQVLPLDSFEALESRYTRFLETSKN